MRSNTDKERKAKMDIYYNVPLRFSAGKFGFYELPQTEEGIELCYDDDYDILSYDEPKYKSEVKLYSVPKELMPKAIAAYYNGSGALERIEIASADKIRLLYIRLVDTSSSETCIKEFIKKQSDKLSEEILKRRNIARLFVDYYYDGENADLAVETATAEEMKEVVEYYHGDLDAADNGGNYPGGDNRIKFDDEALGVILLCSEKNYRHKLFDSAVKLAENRILENISDRLDKTEDFKFISEEYD